MFLFLKSPPLFASRADLGPWRRAAREGSSAARRRKARRAPTHSHRRIRVGALLSVALVSLLTAVRATCTRKFLEGGGTALLFLPVLHQQQPKAFVENTKPRQNRFFQSLVFAGATVYYAAYATTPKNDKSHCYRSRSCGNAVAAAPSLPSDVLPPVPLPPVPAAPPVPPVPPALMLLRAK